MGKSSAFGTTFAIGVRQVETAVVVGTIGTSGNATVIVTASGMTGSPITKSVAVVSGDVADTIADKIRTALLGDANITAKFSVGGSGSNVVLTRLIASANDATLNINVANGTCSGIVNDSTSDDTTAGVASANVAYISNIGGASLAMDTEDVTTHDSTDGWEEVVPTILRSGEVTMDLVYDPNIASHKNTSGGLIWYKANKVLGFATVTFPGSVSWSFPVYITGFEPSAPVAGALTASVTVKISGKPTLA